MANQIRAYDKKYDTLDRIIDYESGTLDGPETIGLFQDLIDTDLAWQLQGHYGRTARNLIQAGYCTIGGKKPVTATTEARG